jgi:hypothetical protein
MNTSALEKQSYSHLCETVAKNEPLQLLHYGVTLKDLTKGDLKDTSTSSSFVKSNEPETYYYNYDKILIAVELKEDPIVQTINDTEIGLTYSVNDHSHALTGFTISQVLPKVTAASGYKVRWCENVASNMIRYGNFKHGREIINEFDNITSDILNSSPMTMEDRESISTDLGNVPDLLTFSDTLPQYTTIFNPSFPFCSPDPSDMFPLYMCGFNDDIKINLVMKSLCQSLLIVAKEDPETGGLTVVDPLSDEKYATFTIDGKEVTRFKSPVCAAHYVYMTQDECDANWCSTEFENKRERKNVSFSVNQAFVFRSSNPVRSGVVSINNITIPETCTQINWMAQKHDIKNNIFSNYTTNPSPFFRASVSPIVNTTISNGNVTLLNNAPAILTTRIASRFSTRKTNHLAGIHTRSFGIRSNTSGIKPGFFFDKGQITCEIKETCGQTLNGDRPATDMYYDIEVRFMCRVNYTFTHFCRSEEERKTNTSIIVKI